MKETIEKTLFDTSSASVTKLETDMAGDGWKLTCSRSVAIYTFEREIPNPPDENLPIIDAVDYC